MITPVKLQLKHQTNVLPPSFNINVSIPLHHFYSSRPELWCTKGEVTSWSSFSFMSRLSPIICFTIFLNFSFIHISFIAATIKINAKNESAVSPFLHHTDQLSLSC